MKNNISFKFLPFVDKTIRKYLVHFFLSKVNKAKKRKLLEQSKINPNNTRIFSRTRVCMCVCVCTHRNRDLKRSSRLH